MSLDRGGFDLGTAYASVEIRYDQLERGMAQARRSFADGVQSISDSIGSLGAQITQVGTSLTTLTAPAAGFLIGGVAAASSFQDSLKNIEVRAGLTADQMEAVRAKALEIGRDTAFSAGQGADAFLQLLTSGQSVEEAFQTIDAVMAGAAASGEDLGFVSDALTDIMAAFKLEASESAAVMDALTAASGSSSASISDLVAGFQNVGGVAEQFGLSVEDTAAILAVFNENGTKSAEAGTQLRSMLNNMSRTTPEVQAQWQALGISMFDAMGNARPLGDVMQELRVALSGMTDQEQINVMQTLAGTYGQLGLAALTSGDSMEDMLAKMDGAASAAEVADEMMQTFSGSVKFLQGSMETLMIQVMEPFMENVLRPMVNAMSGAINAITAWAQENPQLANTIILITGAVTALGPVLIAVGVALQAIAPLLPVLAGGFTLLLSPIGLVAGAVAALGVAWATNFMGMRDALQPFADEIGVRLSQAKEALQDFVGNIDFRSIANSLVTRFERIFDRLAAVLSPLFEEVGELLGRIFQNIDIGQVFEIGRTLLALTNPIGQISLALRLFGVDTMDIFERVVGGITTFLGTINDGGSVFDGLKAVFGDTAFISGLQSAFEGISNFISDTVIPAFQQLANWFIVDVMPQVVNFIQVVVIPAVQSLVNFLAGIWAIVGPALGQLATWFLETALPAIQQFISGTVLPMLTQLGQALISLWEDVSPFLLQLLDWFINTGLPLAVQFVEDVVVPIVETLFSLLAAAWEWARPGLESLYNWFVEDALPAIVTFLEDTVAPALDDLFGFLGDVWALVQPGLEDLFNFLSQTLFPIFSDVLEAVVIPIIERLIDIFSTIFDVLSVPLNLIKDLFETVFNFIFEKISQAIEWLVGTPEGQYALSVAMEVVEGSISAAINNIKGFFEDGFQFISDLIDWIIDRLNEFVNFAEGAINGVSDFIQDPVGAIEGAVEGAVNDVGNAVGGVLDDLNPFTGSGILAGMFADGGRPPIGQISLVGEEGPELFVPDIAGEIIPNDEMLNMMQSLAFTDVNATNAAFSPGTGSAISSTTTNNYDFQITVQVDGGSPDVEQDAYNGAMRAMQDIFSELDEDARN